MYPPYATINAVGIKILLKEEKRNSASATISSKKGYCDEYSNDICCRLTALNYNQMFPEPVALAVPFMRRHRQALN